MSEEEKTDLEEMVERRQMLKDLLNSPGWKELEEIANEQVATREKVDQAMEIEGTQDAFKLAGLRGERRGILLIMALPEALVESLDVDIEETQDATD